MNKFSINRRALSILFWDVLFSRYEHRVPEVKIKLNSMHSRFELMRSQAKYNTGSINTTSAIVTAIVSEHFAATEVAEIGTFIGRSTYAIALGLSFNQSISFMISTCDYSNDIKLDFSEYNGKIKQYPMRSSWQMLQDIKSHGGVPEMYFVDGRLTPEDLSLMKEMNASKAVMLLDDFEGTEKGVVNALNILKDIKNTYLLIYPPETHILQRYGLHGHCGLGILMPTELLAFTNQ